MMKVFLALMFAAALLLVSCQNSNTPTGVILSQQFSGVAPSGDPETLQGQTIQRPISDFLSFQGTQNNHMPYGNEAGFGENPDQTPSPNVGWFDWLGLANAYFVANGGTDLQTQVSGNVTEQSITGGRRVHVTIHTVNAMAFGANLIANPNGRYSGPTSIGAREQDVFAGATPAVGECHLDWIRHLSGGI